MDTKLKTHLRQRVFFFFFIFNSLFQKGVFPIFLLLKNCDGGGPAFPPVLVRGTLLGLDPPFSLASPPGGGYSGGPVLCLSFGALSGGYTGSPAPPFWGAPLGRSKTSQTAPVAAPTPSRIFQANPCPWGPRVPFPRSVPPSFFVLFFPGVSFPPFFFWV